MKLLVEKEAITMVATNTSAYDQGKEALQALPVDDQLALLWFVYTKMGKSVTPAAPGASGSEIAQGLFNQVQELSHDEQLQVMRDIANKNSKLKTQNFKKS
jgi:Orange carotenoid protein, N-terminal